MAPEEGHEFSISDIKDWKQMIVNFSVLRYGHKRWCENNYMILHGLKIVNGDYSVCLKFVSGTIILIVGVYFLGFYFISK